MTAHHTTAAERLIAAVAEVESRHSAVEMLSYPPDQSGYLPRYATCKTCRTPYPCDISQLAAALREHVMAVNAHRDELYALAEYGPTPQSRASAQRILDSFEAALDRAAAEMEASDDR